MCGIFAIFTCLVSAALNGIVPSLTPRELENGRWQRSKRACGWEGAAEATSPVGTPMLGQKQKGRLC